ncbi:MAG TPA: CHAD domain-containing protein [Stellaceae bacterium]|jgi:inorganic triphosphatase YgiF|nr:CHAD domain-containing protein [Stellaceae bacterium]
MEDSHPSLPAHPPVELELKFDLSAAELRRLLRHPLLAGARRRNRLVASTYFDTPELALRDRALSLRIRRDGRHYVQTLKATGDTTAAPVEREKIQAPLTQAAPDLSRPELRERLDGLDAAELQPVFVSRIRRSTRLVHLESGAVVELAYDRGDIETPAGTSLPVCELELELKEGDSGSLFELARALNRSLPLHLEPLSKAARGYALLRGDDVDAARRQAKLRLRPDMPIDGAFAAIVENGLHHMIANDRAARRGEVEGVHQMRVALRRLRAMFKLFKAVISEDQRAHAVGEMKWISGTLGTTRNWDVFGEYVAEVAAAFPGDAALQALIAAAAERQKRGHAAVQEAIASARYTDFVLQMLGELAHQRRAARPASTSLLLAAPIRQLASTLLDRRYRKARKLAKKFASLDAAQRHRFRIALKELRYAVDALSGLYERKAAKRQLVRLAALQDDLGLLNDVVTMERLLTELETAPEGEPLKQGAALVRGWFGRAAAEHEAKLDKRVARFLKAKPFWALPQAA